ARTDDALVVCVRDEGRGIDWDRLAEVARAAGMPASTPAELEAVLFQDGISSRREVTDVSGRGVGMGAARDACIELGGSVAVASERGAGTTFTFTIPHRKAAL